jgi:hypothetical protein
MKKYRYRHDNISPVRYDGTNAEDIRRLFDDYGANTCSVAECPELAVIYYHRGRRTTVVMKGDWVFVDDPRMCDPPMNIFVRTDSEFKEDYVEIEE